MVYKKDMKQVSNIIRTLILLILGSSMLSGCSNNRPAPYEDKGSVKYTKDSSNSSVYATSDPIPDAPTLAAQHRSADGGIVETKLPPVYGSGNSEYDGPILHNKLDRMVDRASPDNQVVSSGVPSADGNIVIENAQINAKNTTDSLRALDLEAQVESRNNNATNSASMMAEGYKISAPLGMSTFQWPVYGNIVSRYGKHGNKFNEGIDIEAAPGTPISAMGDGKVVYLAENIEGYGNLVIIKHADDIMSAYAHLDNISVKRNQIVKIGQPIGAIDASNAKLHFSIRKGKKTINPEASLQSTTEKKVKHKQN